MLPDASDDFVFIADGETVRIVWEIIDDDEILETILNGIGDRWIGGAQRVIRPEIVTRGPETCWKCFG